MPRPSAPSLIPSIPPFSVEHRTVLPHSAPLPGCPGFGRNPDTRPKSGQNPDSVTLGGSPSEARSYTSRVPTSGRCEWPGSVPLCWRPDLDTPQVTDSRKREFPDHPCPATQDRRLDDLDCSRYPSSRSTNDAVSATLPGADGKLVYVAGATMDPRLSTACDCISRPTIAIVHTMRDGESCGAQSVASEERAGWLCALVQRAPDASFDVGRARASVLERTRAERTRAQGRLHVSRLGRRVTCAVGESAVFGVGAYFWFRRERQVRWRPRRCRSDRQRRRGDTLTTLPSRVWSSAPRDSRRRRSPRPSCAQDRSVLIVPVATVADHHALVSLGGALL